MIDDLMMPPDNIGLSEVQLQHAQLHRISVRYWPLKDNKCRPHVGWVRHIELRGTRPVVWLSGKAGFVLASHCEYAEKLPEG
jgi:hypothetical protein